MNSDITRETTFRNIISHIEVGMEFSPHETPYSDQKVDYIAVNIFNKTGFYSK